MKPVRWSDLKWMARSPLHYRYYMDNPQEPTSAIRVGAYAHKLMLGGDRAFVVYDGIRRGKAWDEFAAAATGAEIVNRTEADNAEAVAVAVSLCRDAMAMIEHGRTEQRREWSIAGRDCHGTCDIYGPDLIAELKVTADASPARFPWHARKMLWTAQLEWYANGFCVPDTWRRSIIAVEAKPPHAVTVFDVTPAAAEIAQRTWRGLFETLRVCEAANHWPGYVQGIALIDAADDEDVAVTIDGEEIAV